MGDGDASDPRPRRKLSLAGPHPALVRRDDGHPGYGVRRRGGLAHAPRRGQRLVVRRLRRLRGGVRHLRLTALMIADPPPPASTVTVSRRTGSGAFVTSRAR